MLSIDILVPGGAGYIGSHTCVELMAAGFTPVIVDNLVNSKREAVARIARIAGREPVFVEADVRDADALDRVFAAHRIDAVIHFAGLKAVGESVAQPLAYYDNNVNGTLVLVDAMRRANVGRLVFSSSATVYGAPHALPIHEDFPIQTTNPYGASKAMVERVLTDVAHADPAWRIALLRYFNPVGAHESGLIGEDPAGIPNNLMPYVAQVAVGKLERVTIHGDDYPTRDGTGERDYIHVVDLARGHLAALEHLDELHGAEAINLGTGKSSTVREMIAAFETASGRPIVHVVGPRRPGDIASCYADVEHAATRLGWRAAYGLERMCVDTWRWQDRNPGGYSS
ncbi:MAG: UDP-glucose 4-epimerase GalE [Burkholderiaceae bacterium]